ncbi:MULTISPECIES: hypothetical protein [Aquimarina]|uniref:hypothetical protein n=1 Tax=Aquimarina TaxID=290174 RepID=UPI000D69C59F|nr:MULTISPECIES: hypothetical protein [Aquimarina]
MKKFAALVFFGFITGIGYGQHCANDMTSLIIIDVRFDTKIIDDLKVTLVDSLGNRYSGSEVPNSMLMQSPSIEFLNYRHSEIDVSKIALNFWENNRFYMLYRYSFELEGLFIKIEKPLGMNNNYNFETSIHRIPKGAVYNLCREGTFSKGLKHEYNRDDNWYEEYAKTFELSQPPPIIHLNQIKK